MFGFNFGTKSDFKSYKIDFIICEWFKKELILFVESIIHDAIICSVYFIQIILTLHLLLNPFLHK